MTPQTFYILYSSILNDVGLSCEGKIERFNLLDCIRWRESTNKFFTKKDSKNLDTYTKDLGILKLQEFLIEE